MCIWTLDIGNTKAKLVLFADNIVREYVVLNTKTINEDLVSIDFNSHAMSYCSVVPDVKIESLILNSDIYKPSFENILLDIDYHTKETLGTDRVFAAYGALERYSSENHNDNEKHFLIIIDAGTAITCDVVNIKSRSYLGGTILSGANILTDSLGKHGAQIPKTNGDFTEFKYPAKSTKDSILSGLFAQTNGALNFIIDSFLHSMNLPSESICVYITGGNRENILLSYECKREQFLVNHGLLHSYMRSQKKKNSN